MRERNSRPLSDAELRQIRGMLDEYLHSDGRKTRMETVLAAISHSLVIIALATAYVIMSITGNDGSPLLGVLGGYIGGAGMQTMTSNKKGNS